MYPPVGLSIGPWVLYDIVASVTNLHWDFFVPSSLDNVIEMLPQWPVDVNQLDPVRVVKTDNSHRRGVEECCSSFRSILHEYRNGVAETTQIGWKIWNPSWIQSCRNVKESNDTLRCNKDCPQRHFQLSVWQLVCFCVGFINRCGEMKNKSTCSRLCPKLPFLPNLRNMADKKFLVQTDSDL